MSHVRRMCLEGYARLVAIKLFALRASDYIRVASAEDRRYLLYNPTVKMKVTTQGEAVINLIWDAIAAKGLEKDTSFSQAAIDIRALPKLEGTMGWLLQSTHISRHQFGGMPMCPSLACDSYWNRPPACSLVV